MEKKRCFKIKIEIFSDFVRFFFAWTVTAVSLNGLREVCVLILEKKTTIQSWRWIDKKAFESFRTERSNKKKRKKKREIESTCKLEKFWVNIFLSTQDGIDLKHPEMHKKVKVGKFFWRWKKKKIGWKKILSKKNFRWKEILGKKKFGWKKNFGWKKKFLDEKKFWGVCFFFFSKNESCLKLPELPRNHV